jgi:hypothetical protein
MILRITFNLCKVKGTLETLIASQRPHRSPQVMQASPRNPWVQGGLQKGGLVLGYQVGDIVTKKDFRTHPGRDQKVY